MPTATIGSSQRLGLQGGILLFGSVFLDRARGQSGYRKMEDGFDATVCLGVSERITAILVHSIDDLIWYIPANALVFTVVSF